MCNVDDDGKIVLDHEWVSLSKARTKGITVTKSPADDRVELSEINWEFVSQIQLYIRLITSHSMFSLYSFNVRQLQWN